MSDCPTSPDEAARLAALYRYRILDTPNEADFDDFTRLAASVCGTPLAFISLVDHDRQWFKSALGTDLRETPLSASICRHAIRGREPLIVPDTLLDSRFRDNPLVSGPPHLRFYAGAVLESAEGARLGTLCVLDYEPRELTATQQEMLVTLARKVLDTMELRLSRKLLHDTVSSISDACLLLDHEQRVIFSNAEAVALLGTDGETLAGRALDEFCDLPEREALLECVREAKELSRTSEVSFRHGPSGRWLSARAYPGPGGVTVSCRDITGRVREEAERRRLIHDLGERVKELDALHRVAELLRERQDDPDDEKMLGCIAELITNAMQFPEVTGTRLSFNGNEAATARHHASARWSLTAEFTTRCGKRGEVRVVYRERRPEADQGPFLKEEVSLIDSLAEMLRGHFDQRQAHAALRRSEERFRQIFENAATGIGIAASDGRFQQANPALCAMLGYTEEELLRQTLFDLTWSEDRMNSETYVRELREQQRESHLIEKRYCHKTGRAVWARLSVSMIRADQEEPLLIGVVEDITERKRAEISLAESEERFHQLAEAMPIVVWTATPEGRVEYANHVFYEHTGTTPTQPVEEIWLECLHPADREMCLAVWEDCVKTGEEYRIEYRVRGCDGEHRWTRVQAQPIRDDEGNICRWFGTGIDIHRTRKLQEEASELARSLTATLDSFTDAFLTVGRDWTVTYLNREAEREFGVEREACVGRSLLEEIAPSAGDVFRRELERAMTENVTAAFEEFFPAMGQWFDVRAYPSVSGLAIYLRNITKSRRQLEALSISEERFRLLAHATDDAIWDWDIRADTAWWNEGQPALCGGYPDACPTTLKEWSQRIHPEDRERVVSGVRAFIAGDKDVWTEEYRFRRSDGTYAHVHDRGSLIRNADGEAVRMIGGMSDITERKEAENKLREQATLLDKAQDAILVRDLDHRILYWNRSAERLYGWSAEEALGASIRDLLYREPEVFLTATEEVLTRGEWVGELEQVTRDGQPITVEGRWSLVLDEGGKPRSILAINTDITERKCLEQQFLRAQRMESIGTLAGGIAHDLNNVLAPILMSIDLFKLGERTDDDRELLETIESSARRGAEMVTQVLSFARGVEGRRVEVQPRHLLRELARIIRETFPKHIDLECEIPTDLWVLEADPTQLHQVLLNLCVNARDSMPGGGRLTLEAGNTEIDAAYAAMHLEAATGPHVRFTVADEGHGIPTETLEKIFEPFFTTKDVGVGTGLGLSTSLGIVRSHGGFIQVESRVGEGTRFLVHLPTRPGIRVTPENLDIKDTPRGHGETVLVVDDENSVREVTRRVLESFGYRVLTAADGVEGFSTYVREQQRVEVVITDVAMPVMDGPTMIRAIHRLDPDLPVIASSGFAEADAGDELKIRQSLAKPYTAERLLAALDAALNERL